ncbi:MAG: ribosome-associated translation inhibitor RaiA [Planctomycetaceae bacterium]|nr:ribosome-associated translation inhibitor RaiA [Planctomycetaceae bacterium]MCA9032203.1 ribosome-associated translation inhibitor RaiA [Planctomycetaceae bacterium]
MQVEISCRHGSVKQDFQEYITRKCEKLLTYFERVTSIGVTIDYADDRVRVEILVDAEHKHDFVTHADGLATDVGACFDGALAKMEQQIRKYKEKVQDHRRDKPLSELANTEENLN